MPDRSPFQQLLDRWYPTVLQYFAPIFALLEFFVDHGQHPAAYVLAGTAFGYRLIKGNNSQPQQPPVDNKPSQSQPKPNGG